MVLTWAEDYVKHKERKVKPIQIFLSGGRSPGKSHLVKMLYSVKSEILLYHCKDPEKPRYLLLENAGITWVNIGGTTIHSGLGNKGRSKLSGQSDKSKAVLRN